MQFKFIVEAKLHILVFRSSVGLNYYYRPSRYLSIYQYGVLGHAILRQP